MHIRRLKTKRNYPPNWVNTTVNATGAKDIPLVLRKLSGNGKVRVSVCLTAKADGMKTKPFIVFQGAKRKAAALNKNFKHCRAVASSSSGWINEERTLLYLKRVIGFFSFQNKLLALYTFEAHMKKPAKKLLKERRTDDALIPGRFTKYILAPDVFYNKPFKGRLMES